MKKTTFYWITTLLYWGSRFWLAVCGVAYFMGFVFQLLGNREQVPESNKNGSLTTNVHRSRIEILLSNRPVRYLYDPIVILESRIDIGKMNVDSVIDCGNEHIKTGLIINKIFDKGDFMDTISIKRDNDEIRQKIANGTYKISRTYTNAFSAFLTPPLDDNGNGMAYNSEELKKKFTWQVSRPDSQPKSKIRLRPTEQNHRLFLIVTNWFIMILPIISIFLLGWHLVVLFGRLRDNEVFTNYNFTLIRRIGFTVLLVWLGHYIEQIQKYFVYFHLEHLHLEFISQVDGKDLWPSVNIGVIVNDYSLWPFTWTFITAILIILLAEIFRRGLELQEEQNLTI